MNDQQSSNASKPETDNNSNESWILRCVRNIERNLQERKKRKNAESAQDRTARRTATATWWIAAFTFVAVVVGISQAIIFHRQLSAMNSTDTAIHSQLEEMKKATELDQRAWLVPTGAAFFDKPLADGSRIKIEFANKGKTLALEVGQIDETPGTLPYRRIGPDPVPYIDDKTPTWPTKPLCEKNEIVPIGSVYPAQETYYVRHGARGNIPDLKKGGVIIVVRGCFVYRDAFGSRKSPYCFYSVPANDARIPPDEWTFAPCLGAQEDPS